MTLSDRTFHRLVLIFMGVGFLLLAGAGAMSIWIVNRNQDFANWVNHTYRVENRLSELRYLVERAEVARRGYILRPEARFYNVWRQASTRMPLMLDQITDLTRDNPRQQARLAILRPVVDQQLGRWTTSINLVHSGNVAAALAEFRNGRSVDVTRDIRRMTVAMAAEENRLLLLRRDEQVDGSKLLFIVLGVAGLLVIVIGIASIVIIRTYTRDLTRSRGDLRLLNDNLEEAVAERTTDLQRANDEIQRFAYIVSHDLRSPLVNVMGFTSELASLVPPLATLLDKVDEAAPQIASEDARVAIREDLPEAIRFIRSSTEKMDRLINAILRLSREGRRTISSQSVDMAGLLTEIQGSMQHLLTERGVDFRVERPIPPIISDRLALEQVFSNLIENAVKYLKPDVPGIVTVRGRREGVRIIYEVEDNGRGIDPRDHERIFDLFRRSGAQDVPGEGIGLAHVRALVYRLGGVISCDATLDRGAIFRISLPATFSINQEPAT
jgi:signal transduction histidine kinase